MEIPIYFTVCSGLSTEKLHVYLLQRQKQLKGPDTFWKGRQWRMNLDLSGNKLFSGISWKIGIYTLVYTSNTQDVLVLNPHYGSVDLRFVLELIILRGASGNSDWWSATINFYLRYYNSPLISALDSTLIPASSVFHTAAMLVYFLLLWQNTPVWVLMKKRGWLRSQL
jgi:hypothetical protein